MKTISGELNDLVKKHITVIENSAYMLDEQAGQAYEKDFADLVRKSGDKKEGYFKPEEALLEFISRKTMHPSFLKAENCLIINMLYNNYDRLTMKIVDLAKDVPIFEGVKKTNRDAREVLLNDTKLLENIVLTHKTSDVFLYIAKTAFNSKQSKKEKAEFIFGEGGDKSSLGNILHLSLCGLNFTDIIKSNLRIVEGNKKSMAVAYKLLDFAVDLNAEDKLHGITKREFSLPNWHSSKIKDRLQKNVNELNKLFDTIENLVSKHEIDYVKNIQKNVMERDYGLSFFGISSKKGGDFFKNLNPFN